MEDGKKLKGFLPALRRVVKEDAKEASAGREGTSSGTFGWWI